MIYSLIVTSSPASGQIALTAVRFAEAVLARGHSIHRVFFLDEGVMCGSNTAVFPQDETDRIHPWVALSENHGVELVLCVTSALRYGMLDEREAGRYEKPAATAHPAFVVSGLGQLVDAAATSDRVVSFGG